MASDIRRQPSKMPETIFELTRVEEDIISRHMYPLTLRPPMCKEAWIVCAADKYCALRETAYTIKAKKKLTKKRNI